MLILFMIVMFGAYHGYQSRRLRSHLVDAAGRDQCARTASVLSPPDLLLRHGCNL